MISDNNIVRLPSKIKCLLISPFNGACVNRIEQGISGHSMMLLFLCSIYQSNSCITLYQIFTALCNEIEGSV